MMKTLYRRAALGVLFWASTRSWQTATKALLKMAALGAFGYWAGYSGFGSYYALRGGHFADFPTFVHAWHTWFAWLSVWLVPAVPYTNGFVVRFLRSKAVNAFVFGLFAPILYLGGFVLVFMLWAWTLPFYALWLAATVVIATVGRPFVQRAINDLSGALAADEAATIVRDLAKSAPAP